MISVVILDRDGVINEDSPDYIKAPAEWIPIQGSIEAISLMQEKGYKVYVATNQSGVGRGYYSLTTLAAIHDKMHQMLKRAGSQLDGIVFCPHTPDADCACRKPRPGLLLEVFEQAGVSANACIFVGDSARDLEAASAAGCSAALVLTGNGRQIPRSRYDDVPRYLDLLAFAQQLPQLGAN